MLKKISCFLEWPPPRTVKELQRFLSFTGYYCRFIKGYGIIAQPLTTILKNEEFQWHNATQKAFEELKCVMVIAPILALADFNTMFVVESNASNVGIGVILSQGGRPIAYFSNTFSPKHQVLSICEKEILAILVAVKKWHAYLVG